MDDSEPIEIQDTPLWLIGQQVCNEFQWSDSDQSEIDFELPPKICVNHNQETENTNNNDKGKNKIRYIKIKYGNIVKKIRLNLTDISAYFNVVKRRENYKRFLKIIKQVMDKKAVAHSPAMIVTDDEPPELKGMTNEQKDKQREIWQKELAGIEEEIQTLQHVYQSKVRDAEELKRKLGISGWTEFSDNLSQGVRNVIESSATIHSLEEKVSQWGKAVTEAPLYQKTESVMKATAEGTRSIIESLSQKFSQLKNSESMRSFEGKMGSAYENVKTKVTPSRSSSEQSFSEAHAKDTKGGKMDNVKSPTSPTAPQGKPLQ